jgi:hypothetical protein
LILCYCYSQLPVHDCVFDFHYVYLPCLPSGSKSTTSQQLHNNGIYLLYVAWSLPYIVKTCITNVLGHDLTIIVLQNLLFIGSYGINMDVIHLFVLSKHWYHVHCLNTNAICLFVSFKHGCCMSIHVVYTQKLYTWLSCLNNAWHLCLTNTNLWNNKFHMDLEWTHEACKFVMCALLIQALKNHMKGNLVECCDSFWPIMY